MKVSIVMPTRNGAGTLPAVLDSIARQRVDFPFEIIAVDSASNDGTADLLRGRVDHLIGIPAGAFDHGLTRNLGIERAGGDLVVLIVQDALPSSDSWLAALTAPLLADDRVAGAFARQLPRPDASAVTRYYLSRWVASSDTVRIIEVADRAELEALDPMAQVERCAFDNVCSCIRRSIWTEHPFRQTPIGEDIEWAREVLLAGYRLAYVPAAAVVHSHDRPARYEFARTYVLHRRLYELFRLRTIPTLPLLARAIASSLAIHLRCQKQERGGVPAGGRAIALAFAWPLGQYLGALSAIKGWKLGRSRMV
jgi:glycosyltransferase involved in cell wall biosynthesis